MAGRSPFISRKAVRPTACKARQGVRSCRRGCVSADATRDRLL